MHESFFSYNVTRPYPYRWFTWFIVIGGLIATVLLSVVNLAATGYETRTVYVDNPNTTIHPEHPAWYDKRPWSLASKVSSTCQDQIIDAGSPLYTSSLGLPYTFIGASRIPQSNEASTNSSVAFSYRNDFLHDCAILKLSIEGRGDPVNGTLNVFAYLTCMVYVESELTVVALGFDGDITLSGVTFAPSSIAPTGSMKAYISPSIIKLPYWNNLSRTGQSSLYWGQQMILGLARRINNATYVYGSWTFRSDQPGPDGKNTTLVTTEIRAPYNLNTTTNSTETSNWKYVAAQRWPLDSWSTPMGDSNDSSGFEYGIDVGDNVPIPANLTSPDREYDFYYTDELGLALYSTILSDLGQNGTTNVLASPKRTIELLSMFVDIDPIYLTDPESYFQNQSTSLPSVAPATLSLRYLCQVPVMKATGSVVVGIIVADFVFLQALWVTTRLITTFFLERRDPHAHYCAGCSKIAELDESDSEEIGTAVAVTYQAQKPLPPLPSPSEVASTATFVPIGLYRSTPGSRRVRSRQDYVESDS